MPRKKKDTDKKVPAPWDDELPFGKAVVSPKMHDPKNRKAWGLPERPNEPGEYMVELNLMHSGGIPAAEAAFLKLFCEIVKKPLRDPLRVSKTYYSCFISFDEARKLATADEATGMNAERVIYRIWPDFSVKGLMDRSIATVKGDAAFKSYDASGEDVVWAVIDSGIQGDHPHFGNVQRDDHLLLAKSVVDLHRSFARIVKKVGPVEVPTPLKDPDTTPEKLEEGASWEEERRKRVDEHRKAALNDAYGHGTHVAGIIAGGLPPAPPGDAGDGVQHRVLARHYPVDSSSDRATKTIVERPVKRERLHGVAPRTKLISLRVLDDNGDGRASDVIRALEYIREKLNDDPKLLRVHGVNLSLGYEFDAEMFACGQSPLCTAVDRLVQSGVTVVCAAGNTGYGTQAADQRTTRTGISTTINDPGNAALAITVGATHRDSPHTYGVSYFSSKGPTGDGRAKPDLVAPGERITSAAAGKRLAEMLASLGQEPDPKIGYYVDDSGTSMAAPHVSGAIAAFLSIRREFIGKPAEVKRIFLETATPLGREKYFEGHGLVDLMRAIQSI